MNLGDAGQPVSGGPLSRSYRCLYTEVHRHVIMAVMDQCWGPQFGKLMGSSVIVAPGDWVG